MLTREIDNNLYQSYSDDIPNFLKNIYASRGVSENHLDLSLANLLKPSFSQLNTALEILGACLTAQKRILIVGDFDADGATASVVALKSLRMMGAKYVDFLVPNRFEHGYGLSPEIVNLAIAEKQPDLIITVDNGISSFAGVELAKQHNIKVIITDHHLPSDTLPAADAIINPNLADCDFLSKNLAGVGVSFYLFSAFKSYLLHQDYFKLNSIAVPDLKTVLDLVALGTVADMVGFDYNNRILVAQGINNIKLKKCSAGILALLEISNKKCENLQASDLGFSVAPRLNAAGRLDDMTIGIRCLLTDDLNDARRYAQELDEFNKKRKLEQERISSQAQEIIDSQDISGQHFAISLFDSSWHQGVVGIVAGKIKEKYNCPCAVFAIADNYLKGSIRSIAGVHIKDLLDLIDRSNPDLIIAFGGHAMAAGLSIKKDNFKSFQNIFAQQVKEHLGGVIKTAELLTDGVLEDGEISLENAQLLIDSTPWGQAFSEPVFYGNFTIVEQQVVGSKHLKCVISTSNNKIFNAIAFFQQPLTTKKVVIAYKLAVNNWRGSQSLQLIIEQITAL